MFMSLPLRIVDGASGVGLAASFQVFLARLQRIGTRAELESSGRLRLDEPFKFHFWIELLYRKTHVCLRKEMLWYISE